MQTLYRPNSYPPEIRRKIVSMPPLAAEIANRWMLGWPKRVKALLEAGEYLPALKAQEEQERNALANETARHLARHEIAQEWGLSPEPPMASTSTDRTSEAED
jgi:hypothetical protein